MKNLKRIREEYNDSCDDKKDFIRQKHIANESKIKTSDVCKLEGGTRNPTPDDLLAYSRLCHVSLDYIIIDEVKAKNRKNARVSEQLGVTDAVADTMKDIREKSSEEIDYSAVLNAFIGNGENTFDFINSIFAFLLNEHINGKNPTMDALMISNIMNYLEKYIKPQLTDVLERRRQYEEYLDSIDSPKEPFNPSPDEYKAMKEEYNNNYK